MSSHNFQDIDGIEVLGLVPILISCKLEDTRQGPAFDLHLISILEVFNDGYSAAFFNDSVFISGIDGEGSIIGWWIINTITDKKPVFVKMGGDQRNLFELAFEFVASNSSRQISDITTIEMSKQVLEKALFREESTLCDICQ